jgi:hypothetical protein
LTPSARAKPVMLDSAMAYRGLAELIRLPNEAADLSRADLRSQARRGHKTKTASMESYC